MSHASPHDSLARAVFSQVEYAADEFRSVLPSALVARLDFSTLTLQSGAHVDDALDDRYTDLLYTVHLDGRAAFLYLLLEHQSTVDPLMAYRLWRYCGDIWDRYLKDHPGATRLPLIIPLVLHHSESGWTASTNISELFDLSEETRAVLGSLVPSLPFVLDDLSLQDDQDLKDRVARDTFKLVLWALKNVRSHKDLRQAIRKWADVIDRVLSSPSGVQALAQICRYILLVRDVEPEELRSMLLNEVDVKTNEAFMTGAEILEQRAAARTLRSILTRLLQKRFGELPEVVTERIRTAEPDQLNVWIDNFASSQSLPEVFAEP